MGSVMEKISVIIPVYNSEDFLEECLDSLIQQTLKEIEIICVDDGSIDSSLEILKSYQKKDERIKVIEQKNESAGVARNRGLKDAKGDYVVFLDSDDFFKSDFLEKVYDQFQKTDADIILYGGKRFNTNTREFLDTPHYFRRDYLPGKEVFSRNDIPEKIFTITTPAPWTKSYKRSFIVDNELQFQNLKNSNDAFFVLMSLALANKISYIDEDFIYYRIGQKNNLQSLKTKKPLNFFKAYMAVYNALNEKGIYEEVEKSFITVFSSGCVYNLDTVLEDKAKIEIFEKLASEEFEKIGLFSHPLNYYPNRQNIIRLRSAKRIIYWHDRINNCSDNKFRVTKDSRNLTSKPLVSVIMPVFNTANYLEDSINSILNQSLDEIELICINDGSTDNSFEILCESAYKDDRIVICTQKNAGQSTARNKGVNLARGKYLYFMDSDDLIEKTALQELFEAAENDETDVIYFDGDAFVSGNCGKNATDAFNLDYYKRKFSYEEVRTGPQLMHDMSENNEYRVSPCLQLINRQHFVNNDLWFIEGIVHEDEAFNFKSMLAAKKVKHYKKILFHRRFRSGSTMTSKTTFANAYGYFRSFIDMIQTYKKTDLNIPENKTAQKIINSVLSSARNRYAQLQNEELFCIEGVPSKQALLFNYYIKDWVDLKKRIDYTQKNSYEKGVSDTKNTITFRFGEKMLQIPRRIKMYLETHGE